MQKSIEKNMKIIQGDLIQLAQESYFDVIVHGCNCFNTMGAGIAKYIKQEFPEAYQADCQTIKGDRQKLGEISYAHITKGNLDLIVVNGYTQFNYHGRGILVDYDALSSVFSLVKSKFTGKKIGYPKNWGRVSQRKLAYYCTNYRYRIKRRKSYFSRVEPFSLDFFSQF